MKEFEIEVKEKFFRYITIEADSLEEALDKATDMYLDGEIRITDENCDKSYYKIDPSPSMSIEERENGINRESKVSKFER